MGGPVQKSERVGARMAEPDRQEIGRRKVLARLGLVGATAAGTIVATSGLSPALAQETDVKKPLTGEGVDVHSALAFGAVGDGRADDAKAIQLAIDAVAKLGGGVVHLPAHRTYVLGSPLHLRTGVTLRSERARATIALTAGYAETYVIDAMKAHWSGLENLTLDCGERPKLTRAFHAQDSEHVEVRNVVASGITAGVYVPDPGEGSSALLRFLNCRYVDVIDCELFKCYIGINVAGNSSHVTIDRCYVHDAAEFGMHVLGGLTSHTEYLTISRCFLERIGGGPHPEFVGYPIYITCGGNRPGAHKHRFVRGTDNTIIGNSKAFKVGGNADLFAIYDIFDGWFERNALFFGGDAGLSTDRCRKLVLANNIIGHCHTVGINVWQTNDTTVTGNICYNNVQNFDGTLSNEPRAGIRTYARPEFKAENVVMVGNRCFDDQPKKTQLYGIYIHPRTQGADIGANMLAGNAEGMYRAGSPENVTYSHVHTADALPTAGYWEKGMVVQLRTPGPGQPLQWVCTEAGKPGKWVPKSAFDVRSAITEPPAYVGQTAVAASVLYVATGTAAPADWRKVADLPR